MDTSKDVPDPKEKSGSDIATAPATATGTASDQAVAGETMAAKIDAIYARHLADSALGHHTVLWNAVMAFKADVVNLVERAMTKETR